jgi:hypothetical protein
MTGLLCEWKRTAGYVPPLEGEPLTPHVKRRRSIDASKRYVQPIRPIDKLGKNKKATGMYRDSHSDINLSNHRFSFVANATAVQRRPLFTPESVPAALTTAPQSEQLGRASGDGTNQASLE